MKKSKVVALASMVLVFGMAAFALASNNGDQRNDPEKISSAGKEHRSAKATNIQIHPRRELQGAMKMQFKKEKELDKIKKSADILGIKGKPTKCGDGVCQGNEDPTTCPQDCSSEPSPEPEPEPEPEPGIAATGIIGAELDGNGQKYAIVIGVCDYPDVIDGYGDICTSDGDAKYMTRALHTEYDFSTGNIYLFRDMGETSVSTGGFDVPSHSAVKADIMGAIDEVRGLAQPGDEVVFFFSGHGVRANFEGSAEDWDEGLLVHNGVDAYEYIWDDELKTAFEGFATDRIAFIFDTCLAGGMNDVMEGAVAGENGRSFAAATSETGVAYVWSDGVDGEGLFSHYFVDNGMRGYDGPGGGWADGYNAIGWDLRTKDGWTSKKGVVGQDGYVVIEEAYEYAKEKIATYNQTPYLEDQFTNDLLLGRWVPGALE